MNDFYIGYSPKASATTARVIRVAVITLAILVCLLGAGLTIGQHTFEPVFFEFGSVQTFQGVIETAPYPVLRVARPGVAGGDSRFTLVAPGKHGANDIVKGFAQQLVELRGMLIFREGTTLVEVVPGTVRVLADKARPAVAEGVGDLGTRTLIGEIVDTKCYAGVMNPGQGKVHRDCAARCISGGIPPALLSEGTLYYLVSKSDVPVGREVLENVGQPVRISGRVWRRGDTSYLQVAQNGVACARSVLKQ